MVTRYFRTGPVTPEKCAWLRRQVESLQEANRTLVSRINQDTVNIKVNDKQIRELEEILDTPSFRQYMGFTEEKES